MKAVLEEPEVFGTEEGQPEKKKPFVLQYAEPTIEPKTSPGAEIFGDPTTVWATGTHEDAGTDPS